MTSTSTALIRAMHDVPHAAVERSTGASIQVLVGADEGAPNFATRCFTLAPGGRIPSHCHDSIEHVQVVLEGEMMLGLDQEQRLARSGDCVLIPAGVAHWYENRAQAPVRFLCVVPLTDDYQTEWLEECDTDR